MRAAGRPRPRGKEPRVRQLRAWMAVSSVLALAVPARPELRSIGPLRLNPMHAAAVERALAGAARRLESLECRRILSDFRDGAGAPLQDRLDAVGVSAPDYLSLIVFADGRRRPAVRTSRRPPRARGASAAPSGAPGSCAPPRPWKAGRMRRRA